MEMEYRKSMSELDKALSYSCSFIFKGLFPSILKIYILNQIVPGFSLGFTRQMLFNISVLEFHDESSDKTVLRVYVANGTRGIAVESELSDDLVREILNRFVRAVYTYALFLVSNAPPTHEEVARASEFISELSKVAPGLCVVEPDILDVLNSFSDHKIMYLSDICLPIEISQSRYEKLLDELAGMSYIMESDMVKGKVGAYDYAVDTWYLSDIAVIIGNDQAKIRVAFWFREDKGRPVARVIVTPIYLSPSVDWTFLVQFAYNWKAIVQAILDHAYSVNITKSDVRRRIDIARELIRLINDKEALTC